MLDKLEPMPKLTAKQKKFVDEYLKTDNATQSAINAGYSKKTAGGTAYENLKKPHIRHAIAEKQRVLAKKSEGKIATPEEVLEFMTAVMRGEIDEQLVVVEGKGNGYSKAKRMKKKLTGKDRIKAGEIMAKNYGMFTENIKANLNIAPTILSGDESLE